MNDIISRVGLIFSDMMLPVATQSLDWLTSIITAIVTSVSSVMLGVVLFTLVLKVITLPLDYFSRASMRKSSLKMEEMRPELEKLQKQYANDKQLYQQKMMALYKKEGYSPFGACLPTIVSLVFFIIVLTSFNKYSNYQNLQYVLNMSTAYNYAMVEAGVDEVEGYLTIDGQNGMPVIETQKIYDLYAEKYGTEEDQYIILSSENEESKADLLVTYSGGNLYYQTRLDGQKGFLILAQKVTVEEGGVKVSSSTQAIDDAALAEGSADESGRYYGFRRDTAAGNGGENFDAYYKRLCEESEGGSVPDSKAAAESFVTDIRCAASADKYYEERQSFLWIKNVWEADSPFAHPVTSYDTIKDKLQGGDIIKESDYELLTRDLTDEKERANGYFIMIVLVAGLSFLSQWVMSRGQKAQMELQSVDGMGAMQNKMMMWLMPIMMAFFAFMYTAAFSTYIICSQLFSMLTTLGINKIVDIKFQKEKERREAQKDKRGVKKQDNTKPPKRR